MNDAACAKHPELEFFPRILNTESRFSGSRESVIKKQRRISSRELAVCNVCPVKDMCLEYGKKEAWGVWGGTVPAERIPPKRVYKKRRLPGL